MKKLLLSTAVLALTAACQPAEAPDETTQTETETAAMTGSADIGTWGFDLEGMDAAIIAGDDFYRYANGTWLDNTVIPSDRSNYGMFTALAIEAEEQVQDIILELAAQDAADGTIEQKVGDLYGSWMDTSTIDQLGLAPAQPYLDEIAAAETHDDINALFATIYHQSPYGVGIIPDPADHHALHRLCRPGRSRPA